MLQAMLPSAGQSRHETRQHALGSGAALQAMLPPADQSRHEHGSIHGAAGPRCRQCRPRPTKPARDLQELWVVLKSRVDQNYQARIRGELDTT